MSERFITQEQYETIARQEEIMVTATSGISGLSGGNCTRDDYDAAHRVLLELFPPTAEQALAADLTTPYHRFAEVFRREGMRLSDMAHAQMEQALTELGGTILALKTSAR